MTLQELKAELQKAEHQLARMAHMPQPMPHLEALVDKLNCRIAAEIENQAVNDDALRLKNFWI